MARMYRCMNARCSDKPHLMPGHDFTAEEAVCPKCGVRQDDPRHGKLIVDVKVIHFDPPHPSVDDCGLGHFACNDAKKVGQHGRATGDPQAVNCSACRESEVWKKANVERTFNPEDEVPLNINMAGMAIELAKK